MNERNHKEDNLLTIQLYTLIFSLASIIISMIITYNQKLVIEKKKAIFDKKVTRSISLFNRVLILIIALIFLYVNYQLFILSKNQDNENKNEKLQISASVFTVIAAIITLYIVYNSKVENIIDVENPLI